MLGRAISGGLLIVLATAAGCVAPVEDTGAEATLATTEQALFTLGFPIPVIYPSWRRVCPSSTAFAGAYTKKFFVRRGANECTNVSRSGATGTWIGARLFWEGSQWCSYYWSNTTTMPAANDYWSLNALGEMPALPPAYTIEGTINPLVIPNCQTDSVIACGYGITCVAAPASNTVCDPYGNCSVEAGKIVNPCGTCGVKGGPSQRLAIVVPPEWTHSEVIISPWLNQHYGPSHLQTFQAIPTIHDIIPPPAGTPVQLGLRP